MLTLRDPIQLKSSRPFLAFGEGFCQRILGNYGLLNAHVTPKDLLFLLSVPPEFPEDLGGGTSVTLQNAFTDVRSVTLDVVNNVVNRILLSSESRFTYQDTVYLTSALHKLGVTDVARFMRQVELVVRERKSVSRLTGLYRQALHFKQAAGGGAAPVRPAPGAAERGPEDRPAPEARYYLHSAVYRRLRTGDVYRSVAAFQQSVAYQGGRIENGALRMAEQVRLSQVLTLNELRRSTLQAGPLTLRQHLNHYELGDMLPPPRGEEQVLSQAAQAALVSTVDHVLTSTAGRTPSAGGTWLRLDQSLSQTVENTLSRFETYHGQGVPFTGEGDSCQDLYLSLYREEQSWLRRLVEYSTRQEFITRERTGAASEREGDPRAAVLEHPAAPEAASGLPPTPGREAGRPPVDSAVLAELARNILSGREPADTAAAGCPAAGGETLREVRFRQERERYAWVTRPVEALRELTRLERELALLEQEPPAVRAGAASLIQALAPARCAGLAGSGPNTGHWTRGESPAPVELVPWALPGEDAAWARDGLGMPGHEAEEFAPLRRPQAGEAQDVRDQAGPYAPVRDGAELLGGVRRATAPPQPPEGRWSGAERQEDAQYPKVDLLVTGAAGTQPPNGTVPEAASPERGHAPAPVGAEPSKQATEPAPTAARPGGYPGPSAAEAARLLGEIRRELGRQAAEERRGSRAHPEAARYYGAHLIPAPGAWPEQPAGRDPEAASAGAAVLPAPPPGGTQTPSGIHRETEQERGGAAGRSPEAPSRVEREPAGLTHPEREAPEERGGRAAEAGEAGRAAQTGGGDAAAVLRETRQRIASHTELAVRLMRENAVPADGGPGQAGAGPEAGETPPAGTGEASSAEEETALLLRELVGIDRQNRERYERLVETRAEHTRTERVGPDPQKQRFDALRALENPELVLRELAEADAAVERASAAPAVEAILRQADPATRRIYEAVLRYERAPGAAAEEGLLLPASVGAFNAEAAQRGRDAAVLEHPEVSGGQGGGEAAAGGWQAGQPAGMLLELPKRPAPPRPHGYEARGKAPIVLRREDSGAVEELIGRLEERRIQGEATRFSRQDVVRHEVEETQVSGTTRQVAGQSAEDIAELINRTMARQMGAITDKVYRQMEKKLQMERSRRGRI